MESICPHWSEIDVEHGSEEWCKAALKPCACCGDQGECENAADRLGEDGDNDR